MANLLHRTIENGEVVVLKKARFSPEYKALRHRLFRADGGFGMRPETRGSALYGNHVSDGERTRWEGDEDIDVAETNRLQSKLGKFADDAALLAFADDTEAPRDPRYPPSMYYTA